MKYSSPHLHVKAITPLTNTIAEVYYGVVDAALGQHKRSQTVLYSFVTAWSRISMMRDMIYLMSKGCRIFYTGEVDSKLKSVFSATILIPDTDSIVFDMPAGEEAMRELGQGICFNSRVYGGYKFETETPISSFVSLGAKNYSFDTEGGERVVKSRGFTLNNVNASAKINKDVMTELLLLYVSGEEASVTCPTFRMNIDRKKATIKNARMNKTYRNTNFDKRVLLAETETLCTVPFGCKHYRFADNKCDRI